LARCRGQELARRLGRPVRVLIRGDEQQRAAQTNCKDSSRPGWFASIPRRVPPTGKEGLLFTEGSVRILREWVTQAPSPVHARDDLLLKAYAMWTADPAAARHLFAGQAARHQERLREYEQDWRQIESRHNGGVPPVTHPEFGSYATLKCGIDHERQRIAWLQWMTRQLAAHQAGARGDPGAG